MQIVRKDGIHQGSSYIRDDNVNKLNLPVKGNLKLWGENPVLYCL